jgi:hypothetical protein
LTLGEDDDGHLWNLPRTGAFVFHNTSYQKLVIKIIIVIDLSIKLQIIIIKIIKGV